MQACHLTAATVQELKTQVYQVLCQYEKLEVGGLSYDRNDFEAAAGALRNVLLPART